MVNPMEIMKALADESRYRIMLSLEGRELCVCQLVALLDLAPSTVSKHLSILRNAGLIGYRKEGKWVFYFLSTRGASPVVLDMIHSVMNAAKLEEWHDADRIRMNEITRISREELIAAQSEAKTANGNAHQSQPRVIFVCTANSARSQMAEGLLRHITRGEVFVASAGTEPGTVNPYAIRAMSELGIDISHHRSKSVYEFMDSDRFDYTIFVCGSTETNCPAIYPLSNKRLGWPFEDPAAVRGSEDEILSRFRGIRDEIAARIRDWLAHEKPFGEQLVSRTEA